MRASATALKVRASPVPALTTAWVGLRWALGQQAGEEHIDAGEVFDEDEVAALLAVGVAAGALEHADGAGVLELAGEVVDDAGHAAFVLLARAVDVEVAQADDGALHLRHEAADVVVEDELGVAVDVERALVGRDLGELGAGTVDGRGGGVDEGNLAARGRSATAPWSR